ncbi:TPM domain-containing protein [Flagellimonas meishanensis]|uniref:TPM domain-containing protein n=1 Tax=Flagellimonas meishanensis TaxID=2873264 RepID=UPI001CA6F8C4|nr:TPM domain-containing protein [[Muricauda] meishanensis]
MRKTFLFIFFFVFHSGGFGQEHYPQLTQIVTDEAQIFTATQLDGLRTKLTQFETETTNQLVVLTIDGLGAETIEEYANGTFNKNRLGQKGTDNGILILFAKMDREVRIEVGYGLEPYITDAVASRIIRNTMVPQFKEGQYFEGIDIATDQIIGFLEYPETLEEFKREIEMENQEDWPWWALLIMTLFLSVFIFAGGFVFYKSYRSLIEVFRGMFVGKLGIIPGMFMAFTSLFPTGFGLVFMLMPLFFLSMVFNVNIDFDSLVDDVSWAYYVLFGFLGVAILLAILKIIIKGNEGFKLSWVKSDSTYMGKTFSSSGSHSFGSSSSGGSSSSSSFSGGGGSSGGGGASGSW